MEGKTQNESEHSLKCTLMITISLYVVKKITE